jgi:hypothetical protein
VAFWWFKKRVLHPTLDGNLDQHFWAEELIRACLVPFLALRTLGRNYPLGKTWRVFLICQTFFQETETTKFTKNTAEMMMSSTCFQCCSS